MSILTLSVYAANPLSTRTQREGETKKNGPALSFVQPITGELGRREGDFTKDGSW